jgi:hypothetical protein
MRVLSCFVSILAVGVFACAANAAPSRLITVPPVIKTGNPLTGPLFDPFATNGMWFQDANGVADVRTHEFYDNVPNDGGGPLGSRAIFGAVSALNWGGPGTPLLGFTVTATITNDLPGTGPGQPGRNSHLEFHAGGPSFQGTMFDVKMSADFAFPSLTTVPPNVLAQIAANAAPYTNPSYGGQSAAILALNEDQTGWYCFNDQTGGFYVPTWDFGNIAPGASASRTMNFQFGSASGLSPAHPLYPQLIAWFTNGSDVLMNRTTDLKIGDWVDVLALDTGAAYPIPAFRSGNASVFFNVPEPSAAALLAMLPILTMRRRPN